MTNKFTLLHFNDVYNVEGYKVEPKAGAARFCNALTAAREGRNTLTMFSGDCFSPSMISTMTQGDHMPPILNEFNVDIAVYGNHDFDFGVDKLIQCVEKTNFTWLNSNVYDSVTNELFANGSLFKIIEKFGLKIGVMGLIESEWVATLATVDPEELDVKDFCLIGESLSKSLREEHHCDIIVALTHMRWPNDRKLMEAVPNIDIILGGHDHDFQVELSSDKKRLLLKSGTDFRSIGEINIEFDEKEKQIKTIEVKEIVVDSKYEENEVVKKMVLNATEDLEGRMQIKIGEIAVDLDARFSSIRSQETNIGNLICDIILTAVDAEIALLNSGTLRTDGIIPVGPLTYRDLTSLLPVIDPLVVLSITGTQLISVLENGVSQYPKLEGRFPLLSGVEFAYHSSRPAGSRIDIETILVQKEPLILDRSYKICVKQYLSNGKDGYTALADCPVIMDEENAPVLNVAVQNYFRTIQVINGFFKQRFRFRSSVVSMHRRRSMVVENIAANLKSPNERWGVMRNKIKQQEKERYIIAPKIEGRIKRID